MTPKITTPIFGLEWEKKMKDKNADLDFIKQQIDSWLIEIQNFTKGSIPKAHLEPFLRLMREYGHLVRLDEEYQRKYNEITRFFGKNYTPAFGFA